VIAASRGPVDFLLPVPAGRVRAVVGCDGERHADAMISYSRSSTAPHDDVAGRGGRDHWPVTIGVGSDRTVMMPAAFV
jgi:hypothetical protein